MNIQTPSEERFYALAGNPTAKYPGSAANGILTREQLTWCRAHAVETAYDPTQSGWVLMQTEASEPEVIRNWPATQMVLRPWLAKDAPRLAAYLSSKSLWTFLPEDYTGGLDEEAAQDLIQVSNALETHMVRAIVYAGTVVGQVRLLFGEQGQTSSLAEISYWIGDDHQGQGLASEAVQRTTFNAFSNYPRLERVFARVHRDNQASFAVLQKAGYTREAVDDETPAFWLLSKSRPENW
ncbi:MAG: GNAT family protein [Pseudomonadota bacterium]